MPRPHSTRKATPTSFVYGKLNEVEKSTYTSRLLHLATWCHSAKDLVDTADTDQPGPAVDSLLSQIAAVSQKITSPRPKRKHVENTKRLRSLVRNTPPPSSPSFSRHIAKIQDTIESSRALDDSDAVRKLHGSLVCGCKMKKVVSETLCPNDMHPTATLLRDSWSKIGCASQTSLAALCSTLVVTPLSNLCLGLFTKSLPTPPPALLRRHWRPFPIFH